MGSIAERFARRQRWYQLTLRQLFVLVGLGCVTLTIAMEWWRQGRPDRVADDLTQRGYAVWYAKNWELLGAGRYYSYGDRGYRDCLYERHPVPGSIVAIVATTARPDFHMSTFAVTETDLQAIAAIPSLDYLDLYGVTELPNDLDVLSYLPKLRYVRVSQSRFTNRHLQSLTRVRALENIDASSTLLVDEALPGGPCNIKHLTVDKTEIGDRFLESLVTNCPHLKSIDFSHTPVSDVGVSSLAGLSELASVSMSGCKITDQAFLVLCESSSVVRVECPQALVTPATIENVLQRQKLSSLSVPVSGISKKEQARLSEIAPKTTLWFVENSPSLSPTSTNVSDE
jgi:hypothetical protein